MADDKGVAVQGGDSSDVNVGASARLRNDLDRDGTPDHLAGGYEDSRWESFRQARADEQERVTANFVASQKDLQLEGQRLHAAMENDPQRAGSAMAKELQESLQSENMQRNPLRMWQAVGAAMSELDRAAGNGDRAAELWREGDLRIGLTGARQQYERARTDQAENISHQLNFERAGKNLREAGVSLQAGMANDPQWQGADLQVELQAALQEEEAVRHPERMAAAIAGVVEDLDRQAVEGKAAGQMWRVSDLRSLVTLRQEEFVESSASLNAVRGHNQQERMQTHTLGLERAGDKVDRSIEMAEKVPGFAEASAPAWEAQYGAEDTSELRATSEAPLSAGRWTVQQFDRDSDLYRDVLTTDDTLGAYKEFKTSSEHRVLDNRLNDFAADYEPAPDMPDAMQEVLHIRSDFQPMLVEALLMEDASRENAYRDSIADAQKQPAETLQGVLDRRTELQAAVLERAEAISAAVDQVHDAKVPDSELVDRYADASRNYAAATRALGEFEQSPSPNPAVADAYREVVRTESQIAEATRKEAEARAHGDGQAALLRASEREAAKASLTQTLATHSAVSAYREPEITRNEIEVGLTQGQLDRLMGKSKGNDQGNGRDEAPDRSRPPASMPTPSVGEGHNQLRDQSAFADAADKTKLVPEDVATRYKQDGQKYLDANDPKKVAFVDKGNRLQTIRTFDDKAVEDMVATADARGWTELKVSGDEAFRRKAYIEASARGIEVKGYEPTEQDKRRVEQLSSQTGRTNAIEKNETVEAYRAARNGTPAEKKDAAKKHPELANAFALEQAAKSFAKQRLAPEGQEKLVDSIRDTIERNLAQGKKIPEVRLRQERERRQDHGAEL